MSQSPTSAKGEQDRSAYNRGWQEMNQRIQRGESWSGREPHCCFLNTGDSGFADVSAASGLNFIDDGRAVAITDWDHDGDSDVWLTNRTGPRIRFMRNNSTGDAHFLNLRLEGRRCNRDAIGARIELHLRGSSPQTLIRTVRAGNAFLSQSTRWVHFGLGDSEKIDKLVVHWPGHDGTPDRTAQEFKHLQSNRWYRIVQDADCAEEWLPPNRVVQLDPAPLSSSETLESERTVLMNRVPMPAVYWNKFDSQKLPLPHRDGPLLINLWAAWCTPCLEELRSLTIRSDELRAVGLQIAALSVDRIADRNQTTAEKPEQILQQIEFPFLAGMASREMVDKLGLMHDVVLPLHLGDGESSSLPVPTSFLLDRDHRLAVIYRGPVSVDRLLADVQRLDDGKQPLAPVHFPGKWFMRPSGFSRFLTRFANQFGRRGYFDDSGRFASLAADMASREGVLYEISDQLITIFSGLGENHQRQGRTDEAIRCFRHALHLNPNLPSVHNSLGLLLTRQNRTDQAIQHFSTAVRLDPQNSDARRNLDGLRAQMKDVHAGQL